MNASLILTCLVAAGVGFVMQNILMVRITQLASMILIAMLLNSLAGIVIFMTMLLLRQGVVGFQRLALSVKWWTLIPGLPGFFFVFASISGYQTVGAATTIVVLAASQLVGGLVMDLVRAHGVPVRALIGLVCGAVMLVVGARLVARRQFRVHLQRIAPLSVNCPRRASCSSWCCCPWWAMAVRRRYYWV